MPRIRSLKYEYFINEDLAQISCEARLLGLGLTTVADREGRLEDRPLRLKVLLFPYHNVDVDALLNELESAGFLKRYQFNNQRFIAITKFVKHQKPHPKEPDSIIPSPEKVRSGREKTRQGKPRNVESESQCKPSSVVNGLRNGLGDLGSGDLGSSVNGNGHGDCANAGASAEDEKQRQRNFDIWELGVGKMMATGTSEDHARSYIGKLLRDYGAEALSDAITGMLRKNPVNPRAYLIGVLKGSHSARAGTSKVDKSMVAVHQYIQEHEAHEH